MSSFVESPLCPIVSKANAGVSGIASSVWFTTIAGGSGSLGRTNSGPSKLPDVGQLDGAKVHLPINLTICVSRKLLHLHDALRPKMTSLQGLKKAPEGTRNWHLCSQKFKPAPGHLLNSRSVIRTAPVDDLRVSREKFESKPSFQMAVAKSS